MTNRRLAVASGCAVAPSIHKTGPETEGRAREHVVAAWFGRVAARVASRVGMSWQG